MTSTSPVQEEQHLLAVLASDRFLKMEGLSNEVPFFIYPYDASAALAVSQMRKRLIKKLATQGIRVLEVNLYDLTVELLKERGVWERLLAEEPALDKADFRELLQGMLDPQIHLAPAIRSKIEDADFQILFLAGIGEVFPYIRSHNVLNNLQSVVTGKPMLVFFPGSYEQSDALGSSLVLFGKLKDDQYYRAKNILEQEA